MPALDGLVHAYFVESSLECSDSTSKPQRPVSEDKCPICQFVRLAVPFSTVDVPLLVQAGIESSISFTVSIPSATNVTTLPPCRAPPVNL